VALLASPIARRLRKQLTEAEKRLWTVLRRRTIEGLKFRRQVPLGPYVADFACLEKRIVIEVDGGQHSQESDAPRTSWLNENKFTVLRFWNNDVLSNTEGVVLAIHEALLVPPTPSLPRKGGGSTS
jgi:very-short-patch-repair endonuclease